MGVTLEETKESKYLGIYIQNDLRWNAQVNHVKSKASKVLNFLKRNFHHTSQSTIKEKLYKTLVRPHLDYATSAWDPFTSKNIKDLERVQNAAARFTTSTYGRDTSVTSLKESLGWLPLQEKRRASRLTCLYKMLNGTLDIDHRKYIAPKTHDRTRGHGNQFQLNHTRTDIYANSFFPKTLKEWNDLPSSVVSAKTTSAFKAELSNHLTPNLANRK